jgi:radical SAM protein with 4Fe4S-binding SPASM domain
MRSDRPEMIGWEITRQCNLSCPHCYTASSKRPVDELTTAECLSLMDDLIALGAKSIGWTGGEPLMRRDLEEIVAHGRDKGKLHQGITTNGILLDEARSVSLKEAGIAYVQISLDGSDPAHNKMMRNATEPEFFKVIEGIRACRKIGLQLDLAMLLGHENLEDALSFIQLAKREGVTHIRYCGFVPWGRGKRKDIIQRLLFREHRDRLKAFVEGASHRNAPVEMFDPAFGPLPSEYYFHPCVAGVQLMYISAKGDVFPCTSLIDEQFKVGSIRERAIKDIWNDPFMTAMAKFPRERITGPCKSCEYFARCQGACRGVTYAHTHNLYASFPMCLKTA